MGCFRGGFREGKRPIIRHTGKRPIKIGERLIKEGKRPMALIQEDVNGEKLTMKKWWIFGADFSRFTQSFSRFIRDINGEKNISSLMIFFTVSFSRFAPSRLMGSFRAPRHGGKPPPLP